MRTLRLYCRPDAVPADPGGPFAVASLPELVLAAAQHTATGQAAYLGPLGEVLLLDTLAAAAEGSLHGMAATAGLRRALGRAFHGAAGADLKPATLLALAKRLGKGGQPSPRGQAKVSEVARLYRLYREHLGARRLDAALLWHRGLLGLAQLPQLADFAVVELYGLHRVPPWDAVPTPHGVMAALEALCQSGCRVRVMLPQVDERPQLVLALAPIYDALFRKHELNVDEVHVPLGPEVAGDAPWARFLRGLFAKTGTPPLVDASEVDAAQLTCTPLPSPRAEAQQVARRIRDLVDAGTPPGAIALVAQNPERRASLIEALSRYEVPVYAPPPGGLLGELPQAVLPPPLQALLGLYDTLVQGLPREGLIQAMTSGYFRFPGPLQKRPWQVARALRAAGIRELRSPGLAGEGAPWSPGTQGTLGLPRTPAATAPTDYRLRLDQWLRQQAAQQRPSPDESGRPPQPDPRSPAPADAPLPEPLLAVARQVDAVVRELTTLPEVATLPEHCAALRRLAERLELAEHVALGTAPATTPDREENPADPWEESEAEDVDDSAAAAILALQCLAQARDQAALLGLRQVLDDLPRLSHRLGLQTQPLARMRFATLLRAALLRLLPPPGPVGTAGAGVLVGELAQLGTQRWAQLFITGLVDGELPQRTPEDAVLDDDDRRALNRLCDAPVWPLAQQDGERTPLLFAEALAHSQAAHLSWPVADEEGRPLLRSPLVDAVLQAAARPEPERLRVPLLPWPDQARHRTELWARAALQRSLTVEPADPASREPLAARHGADAARVRACAPSLLGALAERDRGRAARLRARIEIEQLRGRWFTAVAAGLLPPALAGYAGPFVGRLSPGPGIDRLQPRLPGSPEHPLSASALEDYAKCPFRFFVRRVLKAAPLTENGEDLDPLASGRLHHAVLERFFLDRRDAGRLPLHGDAADRAAMDAAVDEELRRFHLRERTGHPELLKVRVRRLRAELQRLLAREASKPIDPGCIPARFEHRFGPLAIRGIDASSDSGEGGGDDTALHIEGIIDRVDLGPGRAVVLDYKAGRLPRYEELLRSQLLETSFQLPLYAAALTVDESLRNGGPPLTAVTARYYSLRQGRVSKPLDNAEMISLDPEVRRRAPEHNVAEVAYRLWRRLRAGDFRIAPRTCEGCGLQASCRIPASPSALAEPPDAEGSTESSAQKTPPPSAVSPTADWPTEPGPRRRPSPEERS